jgi:hypothetical protein
MAGATRFEELIAWQKARALTREVYRITRQGAFTRDFGLAGQMQRAAVSVMSKEFHVLMAAAEDTARLVGALRATIERRRHQQVTRTEVGTQHQAPSTQHPPHGGRRHA